MESGESHYLELDRWRGTWKWSPRIPTWASQPHDRSNIRADGTVLPVSETDATD